MKQISMVMMDIIKDREKYHVEITFHINYEINDENKESYCWSLSSTFHRKNKCAHYSFDFDGDKKIYYYKEWWKYGKLHRIDGPARIIYNSINNISKITYYVEGEITRDFGPAIVNDIDRIFGSWVWENSLYEYNKSEIEEWIKKNDIYFPEDEIYFEIPDEHKAEFKLRFR